MKLSEILKNRFNADVIIICDDHGTGKTTLCNEIEKNLKYHADVMICDEFIIRSISKGFGIAEINDYMKETLKNSFMIISACRNELKRNVLHGIKYKKMSVQQGKLELINILADLASKEKSIIDKSLMIEDTTDSKLIKRRL